MQLDLRIDREWLFNKYAFSVFLEVLNMTYSQAVFGITYPDVMGIKDYTRPMVNGFNWVLPSIELLEPGLVPRHQWRPVTGKAAAGTPNIQWGAVGRRP